MNDPTITYERLKAISGYETPADVRAWAEREGIALREGKHGRPWTTIDALNRALGLEEGTERTKRVVGL